MDPTACLTRLLTAISERDADELLSAAEDLAAWMKRGGFSPDMKAAMASWSCMTIAPRSFDVPPG